MISFGFCLIYISANRFRSALYYATIHHGCRKYNIEYGIQWFHWSKSLLFLSRKTVMGTNATHKPLSESFWSRYDKRVHGTQSVVVSCSLYGIQSTDDKNLYMYTNFHNALTLGDSKTKTRKWNEVHMNAMNLRLTETERTLLNITLQNTDAWYQTLADQLILWILRDLCWDSFWSLMQKSPWRDKLQCATYEKCWHSKIVVNKWLVV